MAIFKHIPSHNVRYKDAVDYLIRQHDEKTGKLILSEDGMPLMRENFLIYGINCTPATWEFNCFRDAREFGKNRQSKEVKTHQYVISFAPKDVEKGLTLQECQALGTDWCKTYFPGHRALVCSHPDGNNQSGNMHCHIIICSIRFEDREPEPDYMRTTCTKDGRDVVRRSEYKAGCKHQDSGKLRRFLNERLQEYCKSRGYDYRESGKRRDKRVGNKEYQAKLKGQQRLDTRHEEKREKGEPILQDTFETWMDELRWAVDSALAQASTATELKMRLQQNQGCPFDVKFARGRISYYHPGSKRWVRGKSLGDDYAEKAVCVALAQNKKRQKDKTASRYSAVR